MPKHGPRTGPALTGGIVVAIPHGGDDMTSGGCILHSQLQRHTVSSSAKHVRDVPQLLVPRERGSRGSVLALVWAPLNRVHRAAAVL